MAVVTMRQLLESGVHFGHQTRRWNPKMEPYILTERNGIYIIDLQQSLKDIDRESEKLIQKLGGDYTVLEPLIKAQMAYQSEILFEVFHQAALDGGRGFQAFIEHELPRKEAAQ